jgi:hypothetical protein
MRAERVHGDAITGPFIYKPLRAVQSCDCEPAALREIITPALLVLLDCFYHINCISLKCDTCSKYSQLR